MTPKKESPGDHPGAKTNHFRNAIELQYKKISDNRKKLHYAIHIGGFSQRDLLARVYKGTPTKYKAVLIPRQVLRSVLITIDWCLKAVLRMVIELIEANDDLRKENDIQKEWIKSLLDREKIWEEIFKGNMERRKNAA